VSPVETFLAGRRWIETMKQLIATLAVIFGLVACTQTGEPSAKGPGTAVPSPAASAEPTGKGGRPATPPTTLDLRLAVIPLSCKLPVSIGTGHRGAFITFPQGDVTIAGSAGAYYDLAFSRWVPAPRKAVAPDGRHYATVELGETGDFTIHVIDVATGKDRPLHEPASAGFNFPPDVLDYASEGIYLNSGFERGQAGLWLVNPATGVIRQLSSDWVPVAIDHGYVWTEVLNPADPNPVNTASSAGILPNEIDRIDLKTGSRTTWIYRPGTGLSIVGFDGAGRPLIVASGWGLDLKAMLFIATDPASERDVFQGDLAQTLGGAISDANGTWIGSSQGIYLYTAGAGLQKVSNQPGTPANGCS
jgi:hypothetical protein